MDRTQKVDRAALKNMSVQEIQELVQELRARSEQLSEELRVLQAQIHEKPAHHRHAARPRDD